MSVEFTMTVGDMVTLRDHMILALRYLNEGQTEKVRFILEAHRDHASDLLKQV